MINNHPPYNPRDSAHSCCSKIQREKNKEMTKRKSLTLSHHIRSFTHFPRENSNHKYITEIAILFLINSKFSK